MLRPVRPVHQLRRAAVPVPGPGGVVPPVLPELRALPAQRGAGHVPVHGPSPRLLPASVQPRATPRPVTKALVCCSFCFRFPQSFYFPPVIWLFPEGKKELLVSYVDTSQSICQGSFPVVSSVVLSSWQKKIDVIAQNMKIRQLPQKPDHITPFMNHRNHWISSSLIGVIMAT